MSTFADPAPLNEAFPPDLKVLFVQSLPSRIFDVR